MNKIQAGFGREAAMPDTVMPLGGVGLVGREYTGVIDPLYITCVALTDENGKTVLLYTQDFLKSEAYVKPMRQAISEATNVPFDHIMIASTHTHSAPAVYYDKLDGAPAYQAICRDAAIRAAQTALNDRGPASIAAGSFDGTGLAFCRHYVMADGTVKKTPGKKACPVAHATAPDDQGQLVHLRREEKPDVLLIGFNIHPTFYGQHKQKMISADAPAVVRNCIESDTGMLVAYFTGAAGNQTGRSQLPDAPSMDCDEYGRALADRAIAALPALKPLEAAPIAIATEVYVGKSNKERIELYDVTHEIVDLYNEQGEAATKPLLEKHNISSVWEVYAIRRRYAAEKTRSMSLSAMKIGGLSFVFAPYEMFGPHGMYIKANTPGDMTFVVTCANESHSYLPTKEAFGWDVYEKLVTLFTPGTGEEVAETMVNMIRNL